MREAMTDDVRYADDERANDGQKRGFEHGPRNGDDDDTTRDKQAKWNVFRSTEKQINETKETKGERDTLKVTKQNEGIKILDGGVLIRKHG